MKYAIEFIEEVSTHHSIKKPNLSPKIMTNRDTEVRGRTNTEYRNKKYQYESRIRKENTMYYQYRVTQVTVTPMTRYRNQSYDH